MYGGKFAFKNRLGQPSSWKEICRFSLFYFVFEGNFQVQAPRGAYIWIGDYKINGGFLSYEFGELIFGGAYTWRGLVSELYGISTPLLVPYTQIHHKNRSSLNTKDGVQHYLSIGSRIAL